METCETCKHCFFWHSLMLCKKAFGNEMIRFCTISDLLNYIDSATTTVNYHCSNYKKSPLALKHGKTSRRRWYLQDRTGARRLIVFESKPENEELRVETKDVPAYVTYLGYDMITTWGDQVHISCTGKKVSFSDTTGDEWSINRNVLHEKKKYGKKAVKYFKEVGLL